MEANKKINSWNNSWKKTKIYFKNNWTVYLLLLPSFLYLIIFCYLPLYGLQIAFKDYDSWLGIMGSPNVGFKHFIGFVTAPNFWTLISNTVTLSLYSLAVSFPLPIILALIINEVSNKKIKKSIKIISYAPFFISVVVLTGILFTIFNTETGVVNNILRKLNLGEKSFMLEPNSFQSLYVWSGVWQTVGWSSILYVSTLAGISPELHEAAVLDGATRMQRILKINLPLLKPIISISLIMSLGNLFSIGFEKAYLMQTSGNIPKSEIIATYVYRVTLASARPQYSFGTAVGLFNSVVSVLLLFIANKISKLLGETSLW